MILSYQICKGCGVCYLQVDFLPHRKSGYCTEECLHYEPRGIPSDESIGWKEKIAAPSQYKRFLPKLIKSNFLPGKWKFDLVQYPRPVGWMIENWILIESSLSEKEKYI